MPLIFGVNSKIKKLLNFLRNKHRKLHLLKTTILIFLIF